MEWVEYYKSKVKNARLIGAILGVTVTISYIIFCLAADFPSMFTFLPFVLVIILAPCLSYRVNFRKVREEYIIVYQKPFRSELIINGEIQCEGGAFQYDLYGQLSDGTQVHAKLSQWSGNVKFAIGDFANINFHNF